ncbi:hypothetical protein TNCV_4976891 [Trichonephila clavipes]|nr:hypothetical protein TNCV_4976891 [Trichonephila clavipes]
MDQYDDDECMLTKCVHQYAAKHGYDHFDIVDRTWIHLKNDVSPLVPQVHVDHTIEDAPVCDEASRVAVAMVSELRVHTAANVVELFVQILVLKTTPILDS